MKQTDYKVTYTILIFSFILLTTIPGIVILTGVCTWQAVFAGEANGSMFNEYHFHCTVSKILLAKIE